MVKAGKGREPPDKSTAAIMESILQVGMLIMMMMRRRMMMMRRRMMRRRRR